MNYILDSAAMSMPFFVPSSVADKYLKLASATQLRVLLLFLKNVSSGCSVEYISEFLKLPSSEVEDALEFWAQAGILSKVGQAQPQKAEEKKSEKKAVRSAISKPTREEIASVAATDERLAFLVNEAQMKLARGLRDSELRTLCWLYLDYGMDVSLILMLLEYAISEGKATVSFIEATALCWIDAGVTTLAQAEEQIEARELKKTAWSLVTSAFGIDYRMPSDKELEFANRWVREWGFSREILKEAYNICIDKNAKISMPYINKILEKWHKDGVTTVQEIKEKEAKGKTSKAENQGFSAYDKGLVEKLLNSDD